MQGFPCSFSEMIGTIDDQTLIIAGIMLIIIITLNLIPGKLKLDKDDK